MRAPTLNGTPITQVATAALLRIANTPITALRVITTSHSGIPKTFSPEHWDVIRLIAAKLAAERG